MEKINLEKILRNQIGYMGNEPNLTRLISDRAIGKDILNAMKEACKQVLELAAENATGDIFHGNDGYFEGKVSAIVNKQSILNTINQVE